MAPDLLDDQGYRLAAPVDIYALGVTLLELFFGYEFVPPPGFLTVNDVLEYFRANPTWRPPLPVPTTPLQANLLMLIQQCWQQDPQLRPSARAVLSSIETIIDGFLPQ
jgi:hypothetical protein